MTKIVARVLCLCIFFAVAIPAIQAAANPAQSTTQGNTSKARKGYLKHQKKQQKKFRRAQRKAQKKLRISHNKEY
jgi:hypothetical protein